MSLGFAETMDRYLSLSTSNYRSPGAHGPGLTTLVSDSFSCVPLTLPSPLPWKVFYAWWTLYKKRQGGIKLLWVLWDQAALEFIQLGSTTLSPHQAWDVRTVHIGPHEIVLLGNCL